MTELNETEKRIAMALNDLIEERIQTAFLSLYNQQIQLQDEINTLKKQIFNMQLETNNY